MAGATAHAQHVREPESLFCRLASYFRVEQTLTGPVIRCFSGECHRSIMANKGKLSNSQLVNQLGGVVDANTVVGCYVQSVIQQGDIKLAALENLPAHQSLARKHAQYWRDNRLNQRSSNVSPIQFTSPGLSWESTIYYSY